MNFERLPLNYDERGTGTSGRTPGVMDQRFAERKDEGNNSDPENWNNAFPHADGPEHQRGCEWYCEAAADDDRRG